MWHSAVIIKLRGFIEQQKEERDIILERLSFAQKVLDRRSMKIVTGLLHKTFGFSAEVADLKKSRKNKG